MALKLRVCAVGTPALAVLAFEILLNAASVFNHSNVSHPGGLRVIAVIDVHGLNAFFGPLGHLPLPNCSRACKSSED